MIIVVANIKGGTGKTTTATQLALYRQITQPERRVWLVDADEQESALDLISVRATDSSLQPQVACAAYKAGQKLASQLNTQSKIWDDIIIDCGGRDSDILRVALLAADQLVVPVLPRAFDIWSITRLETVVQSVNMLRASPVPVFAFINRKDKTAECRDAVAILSKSTNFRLMESSFSDRMAFAKSCGQGKCVTELKPSDKKAVRELESFAKEVFETNLGRGN